jgi:hypothetical protein
MRSSRAQHAVEDGGVGDLLGEIWERAGTTQAPPSQLAGLVLAVVALLLVAQPTTYRWVRQGTTVVHEAGHALVAVLVGRRLSGIRLHSDTSGLTVSRGRARGPGMVATLLAGYPAPALVGLLGAWVLGRGYAVGLLWASVAVAGVLVLFVRNLYGLWVLLVLGAGVAVAGWWLPQEVLGWLAALLVWSLLLAAPRSVLDLARAGRRGSGSDAAQLAALTRVPAALWTGLFLVVTVATLGAGAALLLGWW